MDVDVNKEANIPELTELTFLVGEDRHSHLTSINPLLNVGHPVGLIFAFSVFGKGKANRPSVSVCQMSVCMKRDSRAKV